MTMRQDTLPLPTGAILARTRPMSLPLLCLLLLSLPLPGPVSPRWAAARVVGETEEESDPIAKLSRVFGFSKLPGGRAFHHRSPPQYMVELYNSVTDSGGLTTNASPHGADVVRSFPDKDTIHQMHFFYNVSHLRDTDEKILEAEFHIFKMRPRPGDDYIPPSTHLIEMKVYQVTDVNDVFSTSGAILLDARRISAYGHGWQVFRVAGAVHAWLNNTAPNLGFLVTTTSLQGHHVNGSFIRFAQRSEHHDSKQPILVVFTDDGRPHHSKYISPDDEEYKEIKEDILRREREGTKANPNSHHRPWTNFRSRILMLNEFNRKGVKRSDLAHLSPHMRSRRDTSAVAQSGGRPEPAGSHQHKSRNRRGQLHRRRSSKKGRNRDSPRARRDLVKGTKRKRRSSKNGNRRRRTYDFRYRRNRRYCTRQEMIVDFDEIGWSGWIISPRSYNAYHCSGACPFPLGQSQKPTNHATVQSIVHALNVGKNVETPCCVPDKLYSISLLYFDDDENVILKQYDDMVAASCGCH